jgi:hypothetical protein
MQCCAVHSCVFNLHFTLQNSFLRKSACAACCEPAGNYSVCMLLLALFAVLLVMPARSLAAVHPWVQPTPEELSMTSIPQVPGASAVILDMDTVDDQDTVYTRTIYERIKILTEAGKSYADQELPSDSLKDIAGRTIQPDGKVEPFTGKPYEKTIFKNKGHKYKAKVFTLPDVKVGSILEFQFTIASYGNVVWLAQSDLFLRHAHYNFQPTTQASPYWEYRGDAGHTTLAVFPVLPADAHLVRPVKPGKPYNLDVNNVMPLPDEDFMLPSADLLYRVDFIYSGYSSVDAYWKGEGKVYSDLWNLFIGPKSGVKAAVQKMIVPSDTQTEKLRKIYDAVQHMDNTDYSREHTEHEDKAQHLKEIQSTDDILTRKRGTSNELATLFVALARAAGFKAYLMQVTDRNQHIFLKHLPSWYQLDDLIAIVVLDGREQYFDPGEPYCPFSQLLWAHSGTGGVRQTDDGTAIGETPVANYKQNTLQRSAVLALDNTGTATGKIQFVFNGASALSWRIMNLEGDSVSLNKELETELTDILPSGFDVKVESIVNLTNPDLPLVVNYSVKGAVGTPAGKRLFLPADLFQAKAKSLLTGSTRMTPLYFRYAHLDIDAVKVQYPASLKVESLPDKSAFNYTNTAAYSFSSSHTGANEYMVVRQYVLGTYLYSVADYTAARDFFSKVTQTDQGVVLLTQGATPPPSTQSHTPGASL